jgi:hypothetical protein
METQPGSGKRISKRSAERLRYFGLGFLIVAFAMNRVVEGRALWETGNDYSAVAH